MLFDESIKSDSDREAYSQITSKLSELVSDCVRLNLSAIELAQMNLSDDSDPSLSVALLLSNHFTEMIDGVAILVSKGSATNCELQLRSAFDTFLQALYLIKDDSSRRARSYIVFYYRNRIALYRMMDKTNPSTIELNKSIVKESGEGLFNNPPFDPKDQIRKIETLLSRPDLDELNQHFESNKKLKHWYSAYNGPKSIRGLAEHVNHLRAYVTIFKQWSERIHAGNVMQYTKKSESPGKHKKRHIRHPEGIESVCTFAADLSFFLFIEILSKYNPGSTSEFKNQFLKEIKPRRDELFGKKVIHANW